MIIHLRRTSIHIDARLAAGVVTHMGVAMNQEKLIISMQGQRVSLKGAMKLYTFKELTLFQLLFLERIFRKFDSHTNTLV